MPRLYVSAQRPRIIAGNNSRLGPVRPRRLSCRPSVVSIRGGTMWEAGKLWALTDKVGTVLTIVSFFLTVGILLCAESISSSLKNKVRVPEAIFELSGIMTDMRAVLRAWDPAEGESEAGRQELNVLMHQAVAYLQNIRPRLDPSRRTVLTKRCTPSSGRRVTYGGSKNSITRSHHLAPGMFITSCRAFRFTSKPL